MRFWETRKIVGIGSCRIAYREGKKSVLKIAKNERGIRSNRREFVFYYTLPPQLQKHLGKVRRYGRRWILMKRYRRRFPKSSKYFRKLRRLKRRFLRHGILPYEMFASRTEKPNRQNLRLDRKGRIIVIDYGNFQRTV